VVVAASVHTPETLPFLLAASVAVVFAGIATWLGSRPVARAAVAPLSRLRAHVAAIDVHAVAHAELGPDEQVLEVDELRATIAQLISRIGAALEQAQRFSANAAHELRTPLTAVRAELELLAERPALPCEVQAPLGALRAKVSELGRLVERLLILAAPKRTREEPNEIVSLRDVLEDVARGLPPAEQQRLQAGECDALVRGDSVLLTTLFANSLNNALKFGSAVSVRLSRQSGEAIVDIDDDGPGVAADARERVFEPFYREPSRASRVPGHGLGLALVRHVAESHGGSARFVDKPSRGARLQIRLPEAEG
jgi:signal transduction histidine kinase